MTTIKRLFLLFVFLFCAGRLQAATVSFTTPANVTNIVNAAIAAQVPGYVNDIAANVAEAEANTVALTIAQDTITAWLATDPLYMTNAVSYVLGHDTEIVKPRPYTSGTYDYSTVRLNTNTWLKFDATSGIESKNGTSYYFDDAYTDEFTVLRMYDFWNASDLLFTNADYVVLGKAISYESYYDRVPVVENPVQKSVVDLSENTWLKFENGSRIVNTTWEGYPYYFDGVLTDEFSVLRTRDLANLNSQISIGAKTTNSTTQVISYNYLNINTNGQVSLTGSALFQKEVNISATSMQWTNDSSGPVMTNINSTLIKLPAYNQDTLNEAFFTFNVPHEYTNYVPISVIIDCMPLYSATSAAALWKLDYGYFTEEGTMVTCATKTLSTTIGATAFVHARSGHKTFLDSNLLAGNKVVCRIYRDAAAEGDAYTMPVALIDVRFLFTCNKFGVTGLN